MHILVSQDALPYNPHVLLCLFASSCFSRGGAGDKRRSQQRRKQNRNCNIFSLLIQIRLTHTVLPAMNNSGLSCTLSVLPNEHNKMQKVARVVWNSMVWPGNVLHVFDVSCFTGFYVVQIEISKWEWITVFFFDTSDLKCSEVFSLKQLGPILVTFNTASLDLCGQHDDDCWTLLPYHLMEKYIFWSVRTKQLLYHF